MRLLEIKEHGSLSLREYSPEDVPPYAILSHTWGPDDQEITFQDVHKHTGHHKDGYRKFAFCSQQATLDGLNHFWIDTCCIDKSNSQELQEAINSMFRWFRDAEHCYVFLTDVHKNASDDDNRPSQVQWEKAFRSSRWFTRGWTLQELLAPSSVQFFSKDGRKLGDKRTFEQHIHEITSIPIAALRGGLFEHDVDERMKWMGKRETTRPEDIAYALLGLLGVQMPSIYGEEKESALRRLRREVRKVTSPLSVPMANRAAFDSRDEEHNPRCHQKTRTELVHQIDEWARFGKEPIFWLKGMAGTGKLTVSRTIAQRFDKGMLAGSFFFKRGEIDRGNATKFFTTLAAHFAIRVPHVRRLARSTLDADPRLPSKGLREQFERLIWQPLTQLQDPQTFIIVIDALDECDRDEDIRVIIYLFAREKTLRHIRLRVFLTSRPELPIRLGFTQIRGDY
ncbi:heterokaryon incompatibility protein-domain-containing protein [Microdochium trichocladiopsis]|uniref:Heterokaryon incompatibility protein-domain-containing protein n=1 Tax=Microdochium trichocladiopsis TaxID=1682393 RepID=A0A9P9BLS6_9PEZI|nr:heterokaryon incompatibility protein-domain-containing protein [Microdochium trichocladiopsis]KAH7025212.1 heterokaryon incompatibility protein-domain-containing protein [Microdochium trichocladiopsis]